MRSLFKGEWSIKDGMCGTYISKQPQLFASITILVQAVLSSWVIIVFGCPTAKQTASAAKQIWVASG
jgi:hypothetical protein